MYNCLTTSGNDYPLSASHFNYTHTIPDRRNPRPGSGVTRVVANNIGFSSWATGSIVWTDEGLSFARRF